MSRAITFRPSAEDRRWLEIAKVAGLGMSRVINMMLQPGQHGGVRTTVEWMVQHRIAELRANNQDYEANNLEQFLRFRDYPESYL